MIGIFLSDRYKTLFWERRERDGMINKKLYDSGIIYIQPEGRQAKHSANHCTDEHV